LKKELSMREWINSLRPSARLTSKMKKLLNHRESRNKRATTTDGSRKPPKNVFMNTYKAK